MEWAKWTIVSHWCQCLLWRRSIASPARHMLQLAVHSSFRRRTWSPHPSCKQGGFSDRCHYVHFTDEKPEALSR